MRPIIKKLLVFGLPLILFLSFLPLLSSFENTIWPGQNAEYDLCLKYLSEGTLYGGQPYCGQGPITYVFLFLTRIFTGGEYSQVTFALFFLALHLISLLLIFSITKKETGRELYLLPTLIYISTIFLFVRNLSSLIRSKLLGGVGLAIVSFR